MAGDPVAQFPYGRAPEHAVPRLNSSSAGPNDHNIVERKPPSKRIFALNRVESLASKRVDSSRFNAYSSVTDPIEIISEDCDPRKSYGHASNQRDSRPSSTQVQFPGSVNTAANQSTFASLEDYACHPLAFPSSDFGSTRYDAVPSVPMGDALLNSTQKIRPKGYESVNHTWNFASDEVKSPTFQCVESVTHTASNAVPERHYWCLDTCRKEHHEGPWSLYEQHEVAHFTRYYCGICHSDRKTVLKSLGCNCKDAGALEYWPHLDMHRTERGTSRQSLARLWMRPRGLKKHIRGHHKEIADSVISKRVSMWHFKIEATMVCGMKRCRSTELFNTLEEFAKHMWVEHWMKGHHKYDWSDDLFVKRLISFSRPLREAWQRNSGQMQLEACHWSSPKSISLHYLLGRRFQAAETRTYDFLIAWACNLMSTQEEKPARHRSSNFIGSTGPSEGLQHQHTGMYSELAEDFTGFPSHKGIGVHVDPTLAPPGRPSDSSWRQNSDSLLHNVPPRPNYDPTALMHDGSRGLSHSNVNTMDLSSAMYGHEMEPPGQYPYTNLPGTMNFLPDVPRNAY